jgi:hypothetical protein
MNALICGKKYGKISVKLSCYLALTPKLVSISKPCSTKLTSYLGDYFRTIPQRSKAELSTACGVNTSVTIGKKTVQLQLDKPIAVGELIVRREDAGHILLKSDSDEIGFFFVNFR